MFEFSNEFIEFMKSSFPNVKLVSGGKEICMRCLYCPDSTDASHGHFYVKVPQDSNDPVLFNCFKCHTTGLVDSKRLIEWGVYDQYIGQKLDELAKKASVSGKVKGYNRLIYRFLNKVYDQNLADTKLKYIHHRIGNNITFLDCLEDKVIFNINDVLNYNHIDKLTRHPNIVDQLNKYFVGFLSIDNNFINMRRTVKEGIVYKGIDKRYVNYNIHDKKDNTEKYYILPETIDLLSPIPIQIHLAEGPFDILSIKYNLRNKSHGIYGAITGSGYLSTVKWIMNTYKIYRFELHIYPDNDKYGDYERIVQIKQYLSSFGMNVYMHKNTYNGEKDFGVPLERINESIMKL